MGSKRARRTKRRQNLKTYNPTIPKAVEEEKKEPQVAKLPGQNYIRTGSILLLVSSLLSALAVWWAVKNLREMTAEELMAVTAAAHQTPLGYSVGLMLTSVAAVFQLIFGYQIFRHSNNPFYWKQTISMAIFLAGFELFINILVIILSQSAINIMTVLYGTILPMIIVWGANKNKKFAEEHPNYDVPEPIKMF